MKKVVKHNATSRLFLSMVIEKRQNIFKAMLKSPIDEQGYSLILIFTHDVVDRHGNGSNRLSGFLLLKFSV